MATRSLAKDVHTLLRNIGSMSDGQASVVDWDMDNMESMCIEISPTDGFYKGGKFKFKVNVANDNYPAYPPVVNCLTEVYHPNIDTLSEHCNVEEDEDYEPDPDNSNVCLNILEQGEWNADMSLEDCVQGLLFLFHNPNFEDPLSPLFAPNIDEDEFQSNVLQSLQGGEVEGVVFKRNYGLPEDTCDTDAKDIVNSILNDLVDRMFLSGESENAADFDANAGSSVIVVDGIIEEILDKVCVNEVSDAVDIANGVVDELIHKVFQDETDSKPVQGISSQSQVPCVQNMEGQGQSDENVRNLDFQSDASTQNESEVDLKDKSQDDDDGLKVGGNISEQQNKNHDDIVVSSLSVIENRKSYVRSESYIENSDENLSVPVNSGIDQTSMSDKMDSDMCTTENTPQTTNETYKYHPPYHETVSVEVC